MSTVRDLILEVKRQSGKLNDSAPDEIDVTAFLNRALAAIWNYGARLNSPVLYKAAVFTSATGNISVSDGVMRIKSVRDTKSGALVPCMQRNWEITVINPSAQYYVYYPRKIEVYPLSAAASIEVVYMPFYKRLRRDDEAPFPPELDNAVISLTIALMGGNDSDMFMSNARYGNAVSRYFRPRDAEAVICRGPW